MQISAPSNQLFASYKTRSGVETSAALYTNGLETINLKIVCPPTLSDSLQLVFDDDVTVTDYRTRWISFSNIASPAVGAVNFAADAGLTIEPAATLLSRVIDMTISNVAGASKVATINYAVSSSTQATVHTVWTGTGEYYVGAGQINKILIRFKNASAFLPAGFQAFVFGTHLLGVGGI